MCTVWYSVVVYAKAIWSYYILWMAIRRRIEKTISGIQCCVSSNIRPPSCRYKFNIYYIHILVWFGVIFVCWAFICCYFLRLIVCMLIPSIQVGRFLCTHLNKLTAMLNKYFTYQIQFKICVSSFSAFPVCYWIAAIVFNFCVFVDVFDDKDQNPYK